MSEERVHFLGVPQFFNLNQAALSIAAAFGGYGCYLVGSSLKKRDFRDVDVRFIMDDDEYERLFPGITDNTSINAFYSLLCASISEWLSKRTGLPIDFQIQKMSGWENKTYKQSEGYDRIALGMFIDFKRNL